MSHILTKEPGNFVTVSWRVQNQGGSTGQARLIIRNTLDAAVLASIGPVGVLPGASVTLAPVWTVPVGTNLAYALIADLFDVTTPATRLIASHSFTVNVPAPAVLPPSLQAVGEPTIT